MSSTDDANLARAILHLIAAMTDTTERPMHLKEARGLALGVDNRRLGKELGDGEHAWPPIPEATWPDELSPPVEPA